MINFCKKETIVRYKCTQAHSVEKQKECDKYKKTTINTSRPEQCLFLEMGKCDNPELIKEQQ